MARSRIPWTDYTFNPWWGCEEVSPGCANCYAKSLARRFGFDCWGDTPRRFFDEKHYQAPLAWNDAADKQNEHRRVFVGSMCDVFELPTRPENLEQITIERWRLRNLIRATPHLDWLLLTKRPSEMLDLGLTELAGRNLWIGVTAENQQYFDVRVPILDAAAALSLAARTFISVEPMLGPVRLPGKPFEHDWVICGDESGPRRRQPSLDDVRRLRDDCVEQGISFFFKQWHFDGVKVECPELDGQTWTQIPPSVPLEPAVAKCALFVGGGPAVTKCEVFVGEEAERIILAAEMQKQKWWDEKDKGE